MQLSREINGPAGTLSHPKSSAFVEPHESKANAALARFPWKIFSIAFAAAYLVVVCYFGVVNPASMISYFLGQIAFTLIPGMAMGAALSITGEKVKFICLSYFLGIFINIVFYLVFYLAHLQDFLLYGMIAASALSVFCLYKKRSYIKLMQTNNAGGAVLSITTAICLVMILFYTIFNNFTPDATPNTLYYHDMLWNTGNITALYLQFPPQDLRDLGLSFNYNYLYTMFLAIYKNLFGISSFDLNFKLFAVTQILLFTSSAYLLFQKFIKNMVWVAAAIMLVLFVDGTLFAHVMWAAFSTTFGLVFCILTVYYFFKYTEIMETAKAGNKNFLFLVLFYGMALFAKSTFALIPLAGMGVVLLCQLFQKKNVKVTLLHGIVLIAVTGLACISIYVNVHGFNGLSRGLATLMLDANLPYFQWAVQTWSNALSPTVIKLLCYPVFLATKYTVVTVSFFVLLAAAIKWRREDIKKELFLLASIIFGIVLASVTTQPGGSNALFIMICEPLSLVAIVLVFKRYFAQKDAKPVLRRILCIAVCALVGLQLCFTIPGEIQSIDIKSYPPTAYTDHPVVKDASDYNTISYWEYLGMLWLRNNTPKDAIVAGDRIYYANSDALTYARYFDYTAFSERQFYLEGYNYTNTNEKNYESIIQDKLDTLKLVYQNDPDAIAKLKTAGVTYLVCSDFVHAGFQLSPQYGDVVFKNQFITIYKLN
jgi:hypothetical protein